MGPFLRGCTDVSGWVHVGPETDLSPLADLAYVDDLEVHGSHDLSHLSELRQVRSALTLDGASRTPGPSPAWTCPHP